MRRILVTGLGFVTSIGNSKKAVLESLQNLRHGIKHFPPFDKEDVPIKLAAPVPEFDTSSTDHEDWAAPHSGLNLRLDALRGLAPHGFYAFYALNQALEDSGLSLEDISNLRTGTYTASGGSTTLMYNNLKRMYEKGVMRCPPLGIVNSVVGTLTYNITAMYKILGSSCGFASACASSGHALGHAFDEIKSGRQDRMIVVGGEDCTPETILPFAAMRVLSNSTDPNKAIQPFDKDRRGFVGTGGSVALILEEASIAKKRNAPIYSEMLGWGQATDGYHPAKPHPQGRGLVKAMKIAMESTQTNADALDYINAHGTGTYSGDLSEIEAIKNVFGKSASVPAVSSTKALTGHGLSLASVMEAAFCNLNIRERFITGSAGIDNLDEAAKGINVITESQETSPKIVMSNSSGFGGANVSILFKSHK